MNLALILIILVVIAIVVGFFIIGGGKISEEIYCGEIPRTFFQYDVEEKLFPVSPDTYSQSDPEAKKSLECFTKNFIDCKNARIDFLEDPIDGDFTLYLKSENDRCIVSGEVIVLGLEKNLGRKCEFTKEQTKDYYVEISEMLKEKTDASWQVTFWLAFNYASKTIGLSADVMEGSNDSIKYKKNRKLEKIPCKYYAF